MNIREVEKVAEQHDKKLSATDFHARQWVLVLHEEGTQFLFRNAFVRQWKEWYMVFTEHHRFHVYHMTDVSIFQFNAENIIPALTGTGAKDECSKCKRTLLVDELAYRMPDENTRIEPICSKCWRKEFVEDEDMA